MRTYSATQAPPLVCRARLLAPILAHACEDAKGESEDVAGGALRRGVLSRVLVVGAAAPPSDSVPKEGRSRSSAAMLADSHQPQIKFALCNERHEIQWNTMHQVALACI